jgi:outer membrane lipoprotein-sorting protein
MKSSAVVSGVVVLAGLLSGAVGQIHAQDVEKGASLLSEARKALGGDDKLRGVKTVQTSGTFKRSAGNNTVEGDFEVFIELPNKYRRNETTGNAGGPIGERVEVLNGTETWQETSSGFPGGGRGGFGGFGGGGGGRGDFGGGGGRGRPEGLPPGVPPPDGAAAGGGRAGAPAIDPERLREAQLRQRQGELARLTLMWFLTTDAPAAWVGTAQSPDGTADVIEITPAAGQPTRVFLDSATHMPLMMTTTGFAGGGGRGRRGGGPDGRGADGRGPAPQPQSITIETHLSEYKTVNGIKLPHVITRGVNGQTNEEWEIKNYRVNPSLKSNTFSK